MGGKGQRRREKNYRAVHGGDNRLPPPPKLKELEALPSKLRKIMEFKNSSSTKPGSSRSSVDSGNVRRKGGATGEKAKKANPKEVHSSAGVNLRRGENFEKTASDEHKNDKDATTSSSINNDSKGKRKRKAVIDFRFQELDQGASHSRKKKRKEYLKAKKKRKKANADDVREFPGCEDIKFGEIVEAPPRLLLPKALKKPLDASHERMRLQAIEAYRNRRGWTSRPGVQLPAVPETPS